MLELLVLKIPAVYFSMLLYVWGDRDGSLGFGWTCVYVLLQSELSALKNPSERLCGCISMPSSERSQVQEAPGFWESLFLGSLHIMEHFGFR